MAGSRSRRRRKQTGGASKARAGVSRPAEAARRRPAGAATPGAARDRDADLPALRAEVRALKRSLAAAAAKVADAEARRTRAVARATGSLRRENESLEAQLTLLVQEIGEVKHIVDRVPRLEAELRAKDLLLADRERAWQAERAALDAEVARLRGQSKAGSAAGQGRVRAATAAASPLEPRG